MLLTMMKYKIHRATVTRGGFELRGQPDARSAAVGGGRHPRAREGAGVECEHGRAFRDVRDRRGAREWGLLSEWSGGAPGAVGDIVIVLTYALMNRDEAKVHHPKNVHVDANNRITEIVTKPETNGV